MLPLEQLLDKLSKEKFGDRPLDISSFSVTKLGDIKVGVLSDGQNNYYLNGRLYVEPRPEGIITCYEDGAKIILHRQKVIVRAKGQHYQSDPTSKPVFIDFGNKIIEERIETIPYCPKCQEKPADEEKRGYFPLSQIL